MRRINGARMNAFYRRASLESHGIAPMAERKHGSHAVVQSCGAMHLIWYRLDDLLLDFTTE